MTTNTITTTLQCPPVPRQLVHRFHTCHDPGDYAQEVAQWGFTQGLAAAQRLAAEERQKGADEGLEACCELLSNAGYHTLASQIRAARRPPEPTKREQAIAALRERLAVLGHGASTREAMELALQALEEAGDDR